MSNDYFNPSGTPGMHSFGSSAAMRAEIALISVAFDKIVPLSGNALELVRINASATGQESVSAIDAIPIGSTTPSTGAFTTLSASGGYTGSVTGNASTATALQTARTINGVSFNGTANITVTAAAGTLTGASLPVGVTDSFLTSVGTLGSLNVSGVISGIGSGLTTLNASNLSSGSVPLARLTLLTDQLADAASASNGDAMVAVRWTDTPGVATTQHQVNEDAPTMMMALADSLKAAIRALTSTTDISTQLQAYSQYCYTNNKEVVFPPGQYTITPISLSATGGELSGGMKWTGAGKNATIIKQSGSSSTPLITITGSGNPTTASIMFRDMSIVGNGKTCSGLKLDKIAGFHFDNFNVRDFDIGIELSSTLIGSAINTSISRNNTGVRTRQNGANAFCNLLTFGDGCQIIFNTSFGLDIGVCDTLNVGYGCQIEQNGTAQTSSTVTVTSASPAVVTWNAHGLVAGDPVIFTNSGGALPTGITSDYIYYVIATGLATNTFQFSATVAGSAVNTSSVGTGTHTASAPKTGGIVIRKTVVDELGAVTININAARFEGNHGCDFRSEFMSTAFGLYVNFTDCLMAGTSDGPMIAVGFARKVSVRGCVAPVGSSTWNINADQIVLDSSKVINLRRPGGSATDTIVINSGFGGNDYVSGETGSYTATLTGCTTSPTATVTYTIQGRELTLNVPALSAVSNSNAATLTGMPAASSTVPNLFPTVARNLIGNCVDNGVEKVSPITVQTTGVITLNNAFAGFTAAGTKGVGTGFTVKIER